MTRLFYLNMDSLQVEQEYWDKALGELPLPMQKEINLLGNTEIKNIKTAGRVLLENVVKAFGQPENLLEQYQKGANGKPFIPGFAHFSISHSVSMVVCMASDKGRVGVDIEQPREVNFNHFNTFFTKGELNDIDKTDYQTFFRLWTAREALVKADGRGIKIWNEITFEEETAFISNKEWKYTYLNIHDDYVCCCAIENMTGEEIEVREVELNLASGRVNYIPQGIFKFER